MIEGNLSLKPCSCTAEFKRKEALKLSRPMQECGFLPILTFFCNCTRPMLKADTFGFTFQLSRILNRIEEIKSTEYEISDLLYSY